MRHSISGTIDTRNPTERRYMAIAVLDSRGRVVRWVDGWA